MKKFIALFLSLITFGCAGSAPFFSADPTVEQALAKIAIQQATLRAIQADGVDKAPARAEAVIKIIDQAQAALSSGSGSEGDHVITAEELAAALNLVLPKDLTPADKLLAAQLTALLVVEVNAQIPGAQAKLPVAEISAVLGWVKEAAALAAPKVS